MVRKILMYTDTPFQVMMSIHFKKTILKDDIVDVIISDHIRGYENLANRLKSEHVFADVILMKAYALDSYKDEKSSKTTKGGILLRKVLNIIQKKKIASQLIPGLKQYDEFWSTDILESTNLIFSCLKESKSNTKMVYYEEGPISSLCDQNNQFGREVLGKTNRFLKAICKLVKYQMIYGNYDLAYSSVLELSKNEFYFKICPIPRLDVHDESYIELLNRIWNYQNDCTYENKYVFFEESFEINGFENHDVSIVNDLCGFVGKEKLVIKLHPRSRRNRFEEYGLNVAENSDVPWELIALNNMNKNMTLIAVSSGSIIHPQLYWGIKQNAICLVDCKEYKFPQLEKKYYRTFSRVCIEKGIASVPKNKKELKMILDEKRNTY